ncbi:hypothetical protein [Parasitella parasitica]|uniref:Uncharacterized protein n=1 Tax=Parasitella parasitica TaxID=35722 RepID=A0A0B7N2T7_9FUNG|nr:hypothetical protein [Parasitella parasitica]
MGFVISKPQLNHHLKNNMLISVKKPSFEPEARNSEKTLQNTKNCIFIDEARSAVGTPARVETPKTRVPSHTIIGAMHSSSVIHVVMKKPPPRKEKAHNKKAAVVNKKKRKLDKGKERASDEIIMEEPIIEYVDIAGTDESNKPKAQTLLILLNS